ncbi:MAG: hypothetical protein AAF636_14280, partial [Pseudomonadota bacterium]
FKAGDTVRCQLQTLENQPEPDRDRFFGKGAHVCLGRTVSQHMFDDLSDFLSMLSVCVSNVDFRLRRDDVFLMPETFTATIEIR